MTIRRLATIVLVCSAFSPALAARAFAAAPVAYAAFVKDATAQHGLFTIWRKDGKVYLELTRAQLDTDFVQTIVPSSGAGSQFVVYGNTDHLPAELVRFERAGNDVAIVWPSPYFVAPHSEASTRAIAGNFARTIVGLAPIAATDDVTGTVVIDAAPFLDDQLNLKAILAQNVHDRPKAEPYALDRDRTYFGETKSFPNNVVIEVRQGWMSDGQHLADSLPDPRHLQMRVVYNIASAPAGSDYRPRYADDRVGIYDDVYLSYDSDEVVSRKLRYLVRWNLSPSDPTQPVSPAKHPMVFYMSDTIPPEYRAPIKAAVLKWNDAFLRIGISGALEVRDQPNDPNWDPDDIRYNVLRWVPEYKPSFGADSQTLFDPRTGEEFRTGILISADVPRFALREWKYVVDPARYGRSTDPMPRKFLDDVWLATIMHETGHNLGMQHNFIGSRAYTAHELQDPKFTSQYGIASTVMEYAPLNIWPRGTPQGDYSQTVLGPYDYYAMKWAYAAIPGAATPEAEIPTLEKWASAWSDPKFRYASDEDVAWADGHAADPRVEQGILTNDPLGWCAVQLPLAKDLMLHLDERFPAAGAAYEDETDAFASVYGELYTNCATMPAHYIGGQFISRAHRGDPGAEPPIVPVPRAQQYRAFEMLDRYLFSAAAWHLPPSLLAHLGYSEWSGYGYVGFEGYGNLPAWAYDPPARHDFPYAERIAALQASALKQMLQPLILARIAAAESETADAQPMRLTDLFDWMHAAIFREFSAGPATIEPLRRALQAQYVDALVRLYDSPEAGTPSDARALARAELERVAVETARFMRSAAADAVTRAHAGFLHAQARAALRVDNPHLIGTLGSLES
jgi:hypothetical protein